MIKQLCQKIKEGVSGQPVIDRKRLEKETAGFLNHLAMTFQVITPFLQGVYLTLHSWRGKETRAIGKCRIKGGSDSCLFSLKGTRSRKRELDRELFCKEEAAAPHLVTGSISLASDDEALLSIFSTDVVPVVGVRSKQVNTVVYGLGGASGSGLGATFTCGSGLNFRVGVWGSK
jgi:hypothetical protein